MLKSLLILLVLLAFPTVALAQTPAPPPQQRTSPTPISEVARLVDNRLGDEWQLIAQGMDLDRDQNIQQEGAVWGGPAGDRLNVVRINVVNQSPSDISGAWLQAQQIFDDQELGNRSEPDRDTPQLPCIDMAWGNRDDSGPVGVGVNGFQTLGVLCATSPSEFYVVLYSSFRFVHDQQFAVIASVLSDQ